MPKVAIILGSKSDLPVVIKTIEILKHFQIDIDVQVLSAHRTPEKVTAFAKNAEQENIEVIIAAAGKAAHLPGVIAASTIIPVIGLPVKSSALDGIDSLLSIVQMPAGIPVATVAINGSENAALLAIQILSLRYPELVKALKEYKIKLENDVNEQNLYVQKELEKLWKN